MQVLDFVEREKETEALEGVETVSERRNFHLYIDRKLNWLFKEIVQAQKRLSEAEAEMHRRNGERKSSDAAFDETNSEFESQRLELH